MPSICLELGAGHGDDRGKEHVGSPQWHQTAAAVMAAGRVPESGTRRQR